METIDSPTGAYFIQLTVWEARASQWVHTPSVVQRQSLAVLLSFADPRWSLDQAHWLDATQVHLRLRRYPGDHRPAQFQVWVDCASAQARIEEGPAVPLAGLEAALVARL
ncbi:hypothetical protein IAE35_21645 [Pseudomonas sp. S75]|uniref:hypothetical protein n=1 Tax=unclassified Pseudomonas TaxID=196821 RepID=UPI001905910F|nr:MULTISPECIES: hypothetical protein [unclassified Pseudomonas]MBJ9978121.1 hypothetical protein [Pseudomonas sp. S30]MBK0155952.1 hypothetical protein [Pseudomonas sp. S75]